MGLEFRGEVWTVNIHLIVIKMYLVFKITELNDISKEVDVNRKDLMSSEGWRMWYPRSRRKTFLNEDQGGLLVRCVQWVEKTRDYVLLSFSFSGRSSVTWEEQGRWVHERTGG